MRFTAPAGREQLCLTFTSHVVTITGRQLATLGDLIARSQLALVRPAPTKFAKATEAAPFVESIHVVARDTDGG